MPAGAPAGPEPPLVASAGGGKSGRRGIGCRPREVTSRQHTGQVDADHDGRHGSDDEVDDVEGRIRRVPSRSGVSSPIRTLSRPPPYMTAANTATEAIPTVTRPGVPTRCSPGRSDCLKPGSLSMVERNSSPSTQSSGSASGLCARAASWARSRVAKAWSSTRSGYTGGPLVASASGSRPKRSGSAPGRSLRTPSRDAA